jgi:hypothetical protein
MVRRGFENGSEGGSERRRMIVREDEGPDEERWRCLNAFWAVGRRGRCFWGVLWGREMDTRFRKWKIEKRMDGRWWKAAQAAVLNA